MLGTVHIIDDDAPFRAAIGRLLQACGYETELYDSATKLLERLQDDAGPSCILLDVQMPDLTGPELQDLLNERGSTLPIIFLTAHGDIPTSVQAVKAGAEDFLTKPVYRDQLLQAIDRAINRHRVTRERLEQLNALQFLVSTLTPREREVFGLVAQEKLSKQVAYELGVSPRTIKAHRHKVMKKLRVNSLVELVSIAERVGILKK